MALRLIRREAFDLTVTMSSGARPGSSAPGGCNPLGYYKDGDKTAATFRVIDGVRYSVPGDFAQGAGRRSIHLLGAHGGHQHGWRESLPRDVAGAQDHPSEAPRFAGVPDERYMRWWPRCPPRPTWRRPSRSSSRQGAPGPLQGAPRRVILTPLCRQEDGLRASRPRGGRGVAGPHPLKTGRKRESVPILSR